MKTTQMEQDNIREIDILKGRLAEEVVRRMFEENGYEILNFGMEYTAPLYKKKRKNTEDELEMWIRRLPDFIAVKDSRSYFLEVKYVNNPDSDFHKKFQNYPDYPNTYVVLVNSKEINCRSIVDLKRGLGFHNVYKYFLDSIEAQKERLERKLKKGSIEANFDSDNEYTKYLEAVNRLSVFGISSATRNAFHSYFIGVTKEISRSLEKTKIKKEQKEINTIGRILNEISHKITNFELVKATEDLDSKIQTKRQVYPRAYEPWSELEDQLFEKASKETTDIKTLAKVFQRQEGAIKSRLKKIGMD